MLAEDWCGDVIANVPVLGRIAKDSGKLELRVFLRDQNLDIMEQYLLKGQFRAIPVFVFLDENFNEIGHWIERPAAVTELRERLRREIYYAQHPEYGSPRRPGGRLARGRADTVVLEIQAMRDATVPFANAEVVRELKEIVQRAPIAA